MAKVYKVLVSAVVTPDPDELESGTVQPEYLGDQLLGVLTRLGETEVSTCSVVESDDGT